MVSTNNLNDTCKADSGINGMQKDDGMKEYDGMKVSMKGVMISCI